jgi:prevent-host-death family protein
MKEISISEFKAKCSAVLQQIRKTRKPVRVTRFGKPIAEIMPPSLGKQGPQCLGSMAGTVRIIGDIVGPTGKLDDWAASRD